MINKINSEGWNSRHTNIALAYILVMVFGVLVVFNIQAVHPIWFIITIGIAIWYFYTLYYCNKKWLTISDKKFEKRLFWHSLFYRVLVSIILITVAYIEWGIPDYVGSVDARSYHREAIMVAEHFRSFDFGGAYETARSFYFGIDNIGPPLLIGFIFAIFADSYFMATVVLATLGTISVVLLYRTGKLIWGEQVGRTAGIMFMHFPLSLFFSVVILKEGVVLFLLMLIIYLLTKAVNGYKLKVYDVAVIILALFSLFFFRTVIGLILIILIFGSLALNKYKGSRIKSWTVATFTIFIFGYLMYSLGEYQFFIDRFFGAESRGETRMNYLDFEEMGLDVISMRNLILAPLIAIFSIIPPFPGMVDVPTRYGTSHDFNWYFMPGEIIWNILVFYSLVGFYYSVKDKFMSSMPVWGFTFAYSFAMVVTVYFTRVRFAYLGMPLLLILAALGIYKTKNKTYWILYLCVLLIATVIWNTLRLSARGL